MYVDFVHCSNHFLISGPNYDVATVTCGGQLLATIDKGGQEESIKLHVLQFGALYLFDMSYVDYIKGKKSTRKKSGKRSPNGATDVFDFSSYYFFQMQRKIECDSGRIQKKTLPKRFTDLMEKVKEANKPAV